MKYPCNSCIIVQGLIKEVVAKVIAKTGVSYEEVILNHPNEVFKVEGLEVEKLPALILDGEQITAGNLISTKQLLLLINE
ncbi:MAG: thioredoxin family protein [Oscillospiraceae bacterium]